MLCEGTMPVSEPSYQVVERGVDRRPKINRQCFCMTQPLQEESMNPKFNTQTVLLRLMVLLGIIGAIISALPHPNAIQRSSNTPQDSFKREVSLEFML